MTPSDPELTVALVDSDVRDAERVTAMADGHICGWKTSAGIPYPGRRGEYLYDFWRDAQHPRGVWRRTTVEQTYKFLHRMLNNKRSQPGLSQ
jgi:prolyl oligopeptidase